MYALKRRKKEKKKMTFLNDALRFWMRNFIDTTLVYMDRAGLSFSAAN